LLGEWVELLAGKKLASNISQFGVWAEPNSQGEELAVIDSVAIILPVLRSKTMAVPSTGEENEISSPPPTSFAPFGK